MFANSKKIYCILCTVVSFFGCGKNSKINNEAIKSITPYQIEYSFSQYSNTKSLTNHKDSSIAFINSLYKKDFKQAKLLNPKISSLVVTEGIINMNGEKPFLNGLGGYIEDYWRDSYDILSLTVYLKINYNTRLDLYDKMLRGSLRLDSTNVPALYLLSEVRYKYGIKEDAYYLINLMNTIEGDNPEVARLYKNTEPFIKRLNQPLPSLCDFLRTDILFLKDDN
ncbi:hypothetical protein TH61_15160 [Rufibacter sp. DG15C]|uniref:hypothetical protein n=1 Tax=Rufibacter sp. DG15C TaxID=1379909 RepID=UPI00078DDCF3|nr:hypothetical protein [Rufibacter sp. DG15C]AMM52264.1 hypothetical protein TH61_15160 [Rufibacter sp. DG15C]